MPPEIVLSSPPSPTPRFFCCPYLAPYTVQYSVSRSSSICVCLSICICICILYFAAPTWPSTPHLIQRLTVLKYLCLPFNLYFPLYLCFHFVSHCPNVNQYLFIDFWLCLCVLCVSLFAFLWWICIWFSSDVFPYDPHLRGSNIEYLAFLAFYQYHNGITSDRAYMPTQCCNDRLKGKITFMRKKEIRIQLINIAWRSWPSAKISNLPGLLLDTKICSYDKIDIHIHRK